MIDVASHSRFNEVDAKEEEGADSNFQLVWNRKSKLHPPLKDKIWRQLKSKGIKILNFISRESYGSVFRVQLNDKN